MSHLHDWLFPRQAMDRHLIAWMREQERINRELLALIDKLAGVGHKIADRLECLSETDPTSQRDVPFSEGQAMTDLESVPRPSKQQLHRCRKPRWWTTFEGKRWQCDDCGVIWRYTNGFAITYADSIGQVTCYGGTLGWLQEDAYDWSTLRGAKW